MTEREKLLQQLEEKVAEYDALEELRRQTVAEMDKVAEAMLEIQLKIDALEDD